ncbi:hypothetical protein BABINDRAFT_161904 [Babjeviella inositovora NRRL Y-12698]|uniref:Transcription factor domain-containing protein n=1 Tax=Babjeviella inositovora NRRL Y-12698 TaxID=984486 RepID=A0A1E3QR20_9ASCO|nr:uncharacterized protein BABINDRAFT_161904 [Babjeviella inositovora NRRL Y-12698]ODQ79512.1 hypothetical protein BABINDRAFT_161904 [Babjeviella inositovora NRRL Y-12698]
MRTDAPGMRFSSGPIRCSSVTMKRAHLEGELKFITSFQQARFPQIAGDVTSVADQRIALLSSEHKPDIVDLGLLTLAEAEERLQIYKSVICARYHFVEVTCELAELRASEPFLFLTVMNTVTMLVQRLRDASASDLLLENLCIKAITNQVLVIGNKSLELLKCLLLLCVWNNSPELFHQRRYHLVNSLCVSMVQDLGLSGRPYYIGLSGRPYVYFNREQGAIMRPMAIQDPKSLECQKMVLSVYFVSVSNALFMRRSITVRWMAYLEECCVSLEASGDASLASIASFARLIHQLEKIYFTVHAPDDHTSFDINSYRCRYIVNDLQDELDELKKTIPPDDDEFLSYYYSVEAYLHEPSLEHVSDIHSTHMMAAITRCSHLCQLSLRHCMSLSPQQLSSMPLFYSTRILYTAGLLLRLRYLVITMDTGIRESVPTDSLIPIQQISSIIDVSVQTYPLHNLLRKMRLVLALFIQTYATQVKTLIGKEVGSKLSTELNADLGANLDSSPHLDFSGFAESPRHEAMMPEGQLWRMETSAGGLDMLSHVAHTQTRSPMPLTQDVRDIAPSDTSSPTIVYPIMPTPNYNDMLADPNSLEMSYWALNDEFWTDLVKSNFEIPNFDKWEDKSVVGK